MVKGLEDHHASALADDEAVSIGVERNRELVVGVIFDPNRDEMFTAVKGQGAFCNGAAISTTDVDEMEQVCV